MTDLQFTPNGTYNGYSQWDAIDGVDTYSIVWNSEGYWQMLGWSVGDLRSYSSPNSLPLEGWRLYNTTTTGIFDVVEGDCIAPTPTPTPTNTQTPTLTQTPTNTPTNTTTPTQTPTLTQTPTPTEIPETLIDPIITENSEYIIVGDSEYLMFVIYEPSPTPTNTITPTQTPTETPTNTPTPTGVICSGIPYNLSTIFDVPISGDVLFADFNLGDASNNPDGLNEYGGVYFNTIDSNGTDQTSYFSNLIGNEFLLTLCQNNVTATYSGSSGSFMFSDNVYSCSLDAGSIFIETISANTLFNFGEIVYIDYSVVAPLTPTPTPTITETPTQTPTPTCTRPDGLSTILLTDILISGSTEINITGSLIDACNALSWEGDYSGFYCQTTSMSVGQMVYNGTSSNCTLVTTGYYVVGSPLNTGYVVYIVDGIVDSLPICPTPTPTPTITPTITETPTNTPTMTVTPTITPTHIINCICIEVYVSQLDLDAATGNTNPSYNNLVTISAEGNKCDGTILQENITTEGYHYFCIETITLPNVILFYQSDDTQFSYPSINSTWLNTSNHCDNEGMSCPSPSWTTTPTPTVTETPTPTPTEPFFILAQNGNILTAQNGNGIEYQH